MFNETNRINGGDNGGSDIIRLLKNIPDKQDSFKTAYKIKNVYSKIKSKISFGSDGNAIIINNTFRNLDLTSILDLIPENINISTLLVKLSGICFTASSKKLREMFKNLILLLTKKNVFIFLNFVVEFVSDNYDKIVRILVERIPVEEFLKDMFTVLCNIAGKKIKNFIECELKTCKETVSEMMLNFFESRESELQQNKLSEELSKDTKKETNNELPEKDNNTMLNDLKLEDDQKLFMDDLEINHIDTSSFLKTLGEIQNNFHVFSVDDLQAVFINLLGILNVEPFNIFVTFVKNFVVIYGDTIQRETYRLIPFETFLNDIFKIVYELCGEIEINDYIELRFPNIEDVILDLVCQYYNRFKPQGERTAKCKTCGGNFYVCDSD